MPIVLPGLLIGFLLLVTVLAMYALLHQIVIWLRPILGFLFANHQSFWKRVLLYPVRKIAAGIHKIEHAVASSISGSLALSLRPLAQYFSSSALVVEEMALHLGSWAAATYDAFNTLRNVTVPRLINNAVTAVRTIANQALTTARAVQTWATRVENRVVASFANLGIGVYATLDNALIGLGRYTANLHQEVWQTVVPRINYITGTLVPQLTRDLGTITHDLYDTGINSIDGLRARVKSLEDLLAGTLGSLQDIIIAALGTVAGIAAIEAVLTRVAPDLFCNNTKGVTKKLCGLDESLIAGLLAGTLGLLVALDVRQIAEESQTVVRDLDGLIRRMAGV